MDEQRAAEWIRELIERKDILINDAGDWVYWPTDNRGYLPASLLRRIADELDRLNEIERQRK